VKIAASIFALGVLLWAGPESEVSSVEPETLQAFEKHVKNREAAMRRQRLDGGNFLWTDDVPDRRNRVRGGAVVVEPFGKNGVIKVPDGLVHDWVGAVFVPGARLAATVAAVQNYDRHREFFGPEVVDSRLIERKGNDFRIFLRLVKKKVLTVTLNTEHQVRYFPLDATRVHSRSYSTRISEVEDAGTPKEKELSPGEDHGFLWRLNSYWRFQERDGGVYIECEAISLTRGIPMGLGWLIGPIIRDLPRESLENTLKATRAMVD
jgi:hypothetical protein